jgi:hypothetical protein
MSIAFRTGSTPSDAVGTCLYARIRLPCGRQMRRDVLLDSLQSVGDTDHPWPPCDPVS